IVAQDWHIVFKNKRITLELTVKAGFITDGGSIPWWYRWRLSPTGKFLIAYLVHDIIYATEYLSRAEADWILLELVQELGGNWVIRNNIYLAVRWGGADVWKQHTAESIADARRLIRGFYTGPDLNFEFGFAN
ncbi:MAG: DUF1353 domain-containing protein, partial [Victivallales bacterium]|nr:DUF1353 domain-containing protein [Victivallales bacterium]